MDGPQGGFMTTTTIISVNALLAALLVVAVGTLVRVAHRLPEWAPHHDEQWGTGGDPWVPDPLPLHQVARHEAERALALAA
jgi:predicted PurR-regulated permease PerM